MMMKPFAFALTLGCALSSFVFAEENWPQFRGPDGMGHSDAKGLPLTWSETQNVKWKTPIHGKGWSSPVIWGKQIWMTTATEDGKELFVVCVDRDTGKILHNTKLFGVETPKFIIKLNSPASPTPVTAYSARNRDRRYFPDLGRQPLRIVQRNGDRRDLLCRRHCLRARYLPETCSR